MYFGPIEDINELSHILSLSKIFQDFYIFLLKDDVMYQWKRGENANKQNASSVSTPGKIEFKINAQNGDVSR